MRPAMEAANTAQAPAMTRTAPPPAAEPAMPACDLTQKFVRVLGRKDDLVEFSFSVGWPELSVELLLPTPAFEAFCAEHRVRYLPDD